MATPLNIVVTGTSTGFGYDTAVTLAAAGHRVYGTMRDIAGRNAEPARKLAALGITPVELDVTDGASVDRGAAKILDAAAGRVDVLVNNAGTAHFGTTEAFTPESLDRQFATNVTGSFRVARAFLPGMRAKKSGLVVFVSSVVGRIVIPFAGAYTASKWAVEALAESMSYELRPFGVDVAIVEPGAFPTEIFGKVGGPDDGARALGYGSLRAVADAAPTRIAERAKGSDPADIAKKIIELATLAAGERPLRSVVPPNARVEAINATHEPIQHELVASLGVPELFARSRRQPSPN